MFACENSPTLRVKKNNGLSFYNVICLDKFGLSFDFKGFHFRQKVKTGERIFIISWLV